MVELVVRDLGFPVFARGTVGCQLVPMTTSMKALRLRLCLKPRPSGLDPGNRNGQGKGNGRGDGGGKGAWNVLQEIALCEKQKQPNTTHDAHVGPCERGTERVGLC